MKLILFLCLFFTYSLFAQVLILQFSDTHSAYDNIETFTQNISKQISDFKEIHPQGEVLFIHSGDISGVSQFTDIDLGKTNYDYFAALSKEHHFALTMGNHDGTDWNFQTFIDQVKYFENVMKKSGRKDWAMLAANISAKESQLSKHFKPYQDMKLQNGKKLRVIGLVLDKLFSYSNEGLGQNLNIKPMIEAAKEQYIEAYNEGIDRIIFSAHEELTKPNMQNFERSLADWLKLNPKYKEIKNDLMFSAHDHTVQVYEGVNSQIVSSGSAYKNISKTILSKSLEIIDKPMHIDALKPVQHNVYRMELQKALSAVQIEISKANSLNEKILGFNPIQLDVRTALKASPHFNGILVSNAFQKWAQSEIPKTDVIDYLAFFNSGSYRGSETIGPGFLTYGDIKNMAPFPNEAKIFITKGKYIQDAFKALRVNMGKEHTPQLPSNIREIPLGSYNLHRFHEETQEWIVLEKDARFAIALDGWLGKNGFRIKEFETMIDNAQVIESPLKHESDILVKFLPHILETQAEKIKAECEKLYLKP